MENHTHTRNSTNSSSSQHDHEWRWLRIVVAFQLETRRETICTSARLRARTHAPTPLHTADAQQQQNPFASFSPVLKTIYAMVSLARQLFLARFHDRDTMTVMMISVRIVYCVWKRRFRSTCRQTNQK